MADGKFRLGDTLKDEVTGYEGVAIIRYEHLTSCEQYALETLDKQDGKVQYQVFDVTRLKRTKEGTKLRTVIQKARIEAAVVDSAIPPLTAG